MMPFVAVFGYGTNDVILTVLFASMNLVLFLLVLQRFRDAGYIKRSDRELMWFVLLWFRNGTFLVLCPRSSLVYRLDHGGLIQPVVHLLCSRYPESDPGGSLPGLRFFDTGNSRFCCDFLLLAALYPSTA